MREEQQQAHVAVEDPRLPPEHDQGVAAPQSEEEQRGAAVVWLPADDD
jgi:hypothetical protein